MSDASAGDGVARAIRALSISGRRLLKGRDGSWGVFATRDRRRRPLARIDAEAVGRLSREGHLVETSEGSLVLADAQDVREAAPVTPPRWVYVAASARRPGARSGGVGFAGLAMLANQGRGPLLLRHVQAGLRLVGDAERASADMRLTMNWDAGPVTRHRRSGVEGGATGDAQRAIRELQALRERTGEQVWRLLWALCVDGESLRAVQRRCGLKSRETQAAVVGALEALANAYDGV